MKKKGTVFQISPHLSLQKYIQYKGEFIINLIVAETVIITFRYQSAVSGNLALLKMRSELKSWIENRYEPPSKFSNSHQYNWDELLKEIAKYDSIANDALKKYYIEISSNPFIAIGADYARMGIYLKIMDSFIWIYRLGKSRQTGRDIPEYLSELATAYQKWIASKYREIPPELSRSASWYYVFERLAEVDDAAKKALQSLKRKYMHVITPFLSVGIDDGIPVAIVKGKIIRQCRYSLITVPIEVEVKDADELIEKYGLSEEKSRFAARDFTLEEELFVHASNLQAWVEHDYDVRVIHTNLAWPLLQELAKYDSKAHDRFLEQVHERWEAGNRMTRIALYEQVGGNVLKELKEAGLILFDL